ncbi:MAG TPA: hypothetical protein VE177_03025, partial [Candidatus Binatus sp.]|nr:hypothetical protein [Candidatus Binatus sp.]
MPTTTPDLATMSILFIAGIQTQQRLLMIPLACATLLLSSFSQIDATERNQLAFITYGFSRRKLNLGQFVKGLM